MLLEAPIQKQAYKATVQCSAVQNSALHCTTLHCMALHCTVLHCTELHCTVLHCTALHCTALHCTALHCTALHCGLYASFCIGASISIGREIRCLPYAGFFFIVFKKAPFSKKQCFSTLIIFLPQIKKIFLKKLKTTIFC